MAKIPKELSDLLVKAGINEKFIHKFRFGGVVGKMALVSITAMCGLTVIAWRADSPVILGACLAALFIFATISIVLIALHAHRHPLEATLEGAEIVMFHHIQQEFAAKGMPEVPKTTPMPEGLGTKVIESSSKGGVA